VRQTWRRELLIGLAFLLAVAATFVFGYRAGRQAHRIRLESEPIRAWMSVPFIAHTHHVAASALFAAIGVQPQQPHDRRSVRHLAHELNRPVPEVIDELQHAIDAARKPGGPAK
jgi:hypothetical protein